MGIRNNPRRMWQKKIVSKTLWKIPQNPNRSTSLLKSQGKHRIENRSIVKEKAAKQGKRRKTMKIWRYLLIPRIPVTVRRSPNKHTMLKLHIQPVEEAETRNKERRT